MTKDKAKQIPKPTKLSVAVDQLLELSLRLGPEAAANIYLETITRLAMTEETKEKALVKLLMQQANLMEYILDYRLKESEATNANN